MSNTAELQESPLKKRLKKVIHRARRYLHTVHFGDTLRSIYKARGLTQAKVADRAGVSAFTMQSGSRSATCPWKHSTAQDVLAAIAQLAERVGLPLNSHEVALYYSAAGFGTEFSHISTAAGPYVIARPPGPLVVKAASRESLRIHAILRKLIDQVGEAAAERALRGLCVTLDVPIQDSDFAWYMELLEAGNAAHPPPPLPKAPPGAVRFDSPGASKYVPTNPMPPSPAPDRRNA